MVIALDDFALFVDQDQVGSADLREVHAEGIDPEPIGVLGIAHGDMAGDAFAESEAREQAECAGQMDFAMAALFFYGRESRGTFEVFDSSGSLSFSHKFKNTDFAGC